MTTPALIIAAIVVPLVWGYLTFKLMVTVWPRGRETREPFPPDSDDEPHIDYQI